MIDQNHYLFRCHTFQERDNWIYAIKKSISLQRYSDNNKMGNFFAQ